MADPVPPVLTPPLFREPLVLREPLTMTSRWQQWFEILLRRQASVQAKLIELEDRLAALEGP